MDILQEWANDNNIIIETDDNNIYIRNINISGFKHDITIKHTQNDQFFQQCVESGQQGRCLPSYEVKTPYGIFKIIDGFKGIDIELINVKKDYQRKKIQLIKNNGIVKFIF